MRFILASSSPRRALLLQQIGISFEVMVPGVSEEVDLGLSASDVVETLALRKGHAVAAQDAIVISADTIVYHEGKILGKPKSRLEAQKMLMALRGKTHEVFTGLCLNHTSTGEILLGHTQTMVTFADFSEHLLHAYLQSEEPYDKAGAYGIQGQGVAFVEKLDGDYTNVVGLPIPLLVTFLDKLGLTWWSTPMQN